MVYHEKTVSRKEIYKGHIINVRVDTVSMPDGTTAERDIVDHPGGVGIVPVLDNGNILMVEQFRKPLDIAIMEIPAGKLDGGEHHLDCGMRELEEETGYKSEDFTYLGHFYPTPGFANETTYLYMAKNLFKGKQKLDEHEFLDVVEVSMDEAIRRIMSNEINDAKSIIGILKARELLRSEGR